MDLKLKDKVVVITGSTGGVGEALVRAFAAEGCKLAISSTQQKKLDAMLPGIDIAPENLLTFVVDVTKEEQIRDMIEKTIAHYGRLDVMVNNAGYEGKSLPLDQQTMEAAVLSISRADMLIVGGTSLVVYPAAGHQQCQLLERTHVQLSACGDAALHSQHVLCWLSGGDHFPWPPFQGVMPRQCAYSHSCLLTDLWRGAYRESADRRSTF